MSTGTESGHKGTSRASRARGIRGWVKADVVNVVPGAALEAIGSDRSDGQESTGLIAYDTDTYLKCSVRGPQSWAKLGGRQLRRHMFIVRGDLM